VKQPWIKFYHRDWLAEASLRSLSARDRGVWIDLLCVMAAAEPYGTLSIAGRPMTDEEAARVIGVGLEDYQAAIQRLESAGTLSRNTDGAVISRRLIRDYQYHEQRRRCGSRGGNPLLSGKEETISHIPDTRHQREVIHIGEANGAKEDNLNVSSKDNLNTSNPEEARAQDEDFSQFPTERAAYQQLMDTKCVHLLRWADWLKICQTYPRSEICGKNLNEALSAVMNQAGGVNNGFSYLSRVASNLEARAAKTGQTGRYVSRLT
jgi:hypothetical protein